MTRRLSEAWLPIAARDTGPSAEPAVVGLDAKLRTENLSPADYVRVAKFAVERG